MLAKRAEIGKLKKRISEKKRKKRGKIYKSTEADQEELEGVIVHERKRFDTRNEREGREDDRRMG